MSGLGQPLMWTCGWGPHQFSRHFASRRQTGNSIWSLCISVRGVCSQLFHRYMTSFSVVRPFLVQGKRACLSLTEAKVESKPPDLPEVSNRFVWRGYTAPFFDVSCTGLSIQATSTDT